MNRGRKVLVFGGSFDPVHLGHLRAAAAVKRRLRLDEVLFIPCARSAYGKRLMPGSARLKMLRLALRGKPGFRVLDVELKRGGVSRTVVTLRALRKRRPRDHFYLLLGLDQARRVGKWKDWAGIQALADVLWIRRPGYKNVLPCLAGRPVGRLIRVSQYDISSTDIRRRRAENLSLARLIPGQIRRVLTKSLGSLTKL